MSHFIKCLDTRFLYTRFARVKKYIFRKLGTMFWNTCITKNRLAGVNCLSIPHIDPLLNPAEYVDIAMYRYATVFTCAVMFSVLGAITVPVTRITFRIACYPLSRIYISTFRSPQVQRVKRTYILTVCCSLLHQ